MNNELLQRIGTSIILFTILLLAIKSKSHIPVYIILFVSLLIILFTELPKLFDFKKKIYWLILPIYPILPFILIFLLEYQNKRQLLILLITLIASTDIGSYVTGKIFGYNKICPSISPGKSFEGLIGGILFTCLIARIFFFNSFKITIFFTIPFCIIAFLGDLFESALKRRANLKDSGSVLPGHGGLLDRLDSSLFAVFYIYLVQKWL